MSAPDIFLLMDRSGMGRLVRILHDVFAGRRISTHDDEIHISNDEQDLYYCNVQDFDLEEYILFSLELDESDEFLGTLQRFGEPHVCRITTRDLAKLNEVALALHREIDFVMDNDHGLLIDKQRFLRLYADGTDWLRLAPT